MKKTGSLVRAYGPLQRGLSSSSPGCLQADMGGEGVKRSHEEGCSRDSPRQIHLSLRDRH